MVYLGPDVFAVCVIVPKPTELGMLAGVLQDVRKSTLALLAKWRSIS